jgi:methionine-rich copper-binding protein CopC
MKSIIPLIWVALLFSTTSAWANAFLDHAEPAVGSSVDGPPKEIKIWFTEELEPALSQIQLFDHRGKPVTQEHASVDPADPSLLNLPVPAMRPGKYRVTWRVMSVDSHMTVGAFFFVIRKKRWSIRKPIL